jgi:hypothetical protein
VISGDPLANWEVLLGCVVVPQVVPVPHEENAAVLPQMPPTYRSSSSFEAEGVTLAKVAVKLLLVVLAFAVSTGDVVFAYANAHMV